MDGRLSALFQSTVECFERATLLNIHVAIDKKPEIQPSLGDYSQSVSAVSSGLQLKTLSWSSEMIHCTWFYIIMALVIIYYPLFPPLSSAGMPMEMMHSMVQIFALCLPCSCQASVQQTTTAALLHFGLFGLPLSSLWNSCQLPRAGT